jgi:uncharacterized protein (DUF1778 family)
LVYGRKFVLANALASAEQVVKGNEAITLQPKAFEAFVAALDKPKPNAALKRAFKRHAKLVRE